MATSGAGGLPGATPRAQAALGARPAGWDVDSLADLAVQNATALGGSGFPVDEAYTRDLTRRAFARGLTPTGYARQLAAIYASGSRADLLPRIRARTLVLHGSEDPLLPPACGEDIARRVPGARLVLIPGLGHSLNPAIGDVFAPMILAHVGAS
jgi:pimeloyl-ACP methyl ester carboxylesterase